MFKSCSSDGSGSHVLPEACSSPRGALLDLVALRSTHPLVRCRAGRDAAVECRTAVAGSDLLDVLMIALATVQEPNRDLRLASAHSDLGPRIVVHGGLREGRACDQEGVAGALRVN